MSRVHWMQDRVKITRRIPTLNRGIVENVNRGIVEENPDKYPDSERDELTDWIPARMRLPSGEETNPLQVKVDLGVQYELVLHAFDVHGKQICPIQSDEFIIKYSRDSELMDVSSRLRIVGTIEEVRKRSKLFSYIVPVVHDTEF